MIRMIDAISFQKFYLDTDVSPTGLDTLISRGVHIQKADLMHADISIINLLIREDSEAPGSSAFLIDLEFAIVGKMACAEKYIPKVGTRPFMAIIQLRRPEKFGHHCFRYDLESFFWVLFWICIHYEGPEQPVQAAIAFEKWCEANDEDLADWKELEIGEEARLRETTRDAFTPHYKPLTPCILALREVVFPDGRPRTNCDKSLDMAAKMTEVLQKAQRDLTEAGMS